MRLQTLQPLGMSDHAPRTEGWLRCLQMHAAVINFETSGQELLSLHCGGQGLSPMGWLLRRTDFLRISAQLRVSNAKQTRNGIQIGQLLLSYPSRRLRLFPHIKLLSGDVITQLLSGLAIPTGLCGTLHHVIAAPLPPLLQQLTMCVWQMMQGHSTDLRDLIGLGPGLTPSVDDMLVAIYAVLYADPLFSSTFNRRILAVDLPLTSLTTKVSAAFLHHAIRGHFSTPLLSIVAMLQKDRLRSEHLSRFLKHGHTSGADSLLGLWIGIKLINEFYANRRTAEC